MADLQAELVQVVRLPGVDGGLNILDDVDAVDDEVLANVPGEGDWVREDLDNRQQLLDLVSNALAVANQVFDHVGELGEVLHTVQFLVKVGLVAVLESPFGSGDNLLDIMNAGLELVKALGADGTFEEAFDEVKSFVSSQIDGLREVVGDLGMS